MLEILVLNYKSVIKIAINTFIIILIFTFIFRKTIINIIDKNWKSDSDNPIQIIVTSLIDSKNENFKKILNNYFKPYLKDSLLPIDKIFELFIKSITTIKDKLKSLRMRIFTVRNILLEFYKKIIIKIKQNYLAMMLSYSKIQESLKKSYGLLTYLMYTVETSYTALELLLKSPITNFGKFAETYGLSASVLTFGESGIPLWHGALCFSPNTEIIANNKKINLNLTKTNDILENSNKILAKIVTFTVSDLYSIDEIIVSGDHLMLDYNKYKRVNNISRSKKCINHNLKYLVSLITSQGVIKIKDNTFKDYLDTHDQDINKTIRQYVYQSVNSEKCTSENSGCNDLISGIDPYIEIVNKDDIIGYVTIAENVLDIFEYHNKILSGNILVYHNYKWKRVCNLKESKYVGKNKIKYVHYITKTNTLDLNKIYVRDFCEISDNYVNNQIDNFVDKYINE